MLARLQGIVDPWLEQFGLSLKLADTWRANEGARISSLGNGVYRSVQSAGQLAIDLGIGVFSQFFILKDVEVWRTWGRSKTGLGRDTFDQIALAGFKSVQAVFQGVVVVACLQGTIIGLTYMVAGLPNWVAVAVLSGLLCIVPFLGAPVVYVPVAAILLSRGQTWQGILVLAVGVGIVSQIDNLLRPFFIAGKVGLHPLVVFVSLLGGVLLLGPVGLIAGPTVVSVLNVLWSRSLGKSEAVPVEAPDEAHDTSSRMGLSDADAAARLAAEGFNELPSTKVSSPLSTAFNVVREPMFLLLIACATVYVFLGDKAEAAMLSSAVFVVVGITFFQERKTERTLEALRDLSSPRALVIRGGEQKRIAGREVVVGDLLVLAEGDRVPADCILIEGLNIAIDESLLTGESAPVRKVAGSDAEIQRPGGDDTAYLFSGTLVVQGRGIALVKATAGATEIGKIGESLTGVNQEPTLLQTSTNRLVRILSLSGLVLCGILIVTFGLTRGSWLQAVLAGITMAMAAIPEEFPVILSIFLALGAWRIAQKNVLTRRVPAIETLGAATVLCVDKTGTLTQNRMTVAQMRSHQEVTEIAEDQVPDSFSELAKTAMLASQQEPFDPMEKAIHALKGGFAPKNGWVLSRQYALSPALLAMTHAWQVPGEPGFAIAAKGAPEAISLLCRLDTEQTRAVEADVVAFAEQGLRVIGVAKSSFASENLPEDQQSFAFDFLGLIGLNDPVRPGVDAAVKECYDAGIRVIMITGDYPQTAKSIAQKIGLRSSDLVLTGQEMSEMTPEGLQEKVKSFNVFARVMPEQKLVLVNALKANHEVVAMTGDGVNDAPALKAADIGIAMGLRGTDVAREAADLVLLDDDFSSIVQATRLGRRIYANIKDAMSYVLAVHVPIAGLSLIPVLVGWPLILLPVHIVFLELIIDPACSIVFEGEPEDEDTMRKPPRDRDEPLFTRSALALSLMQGVGVLAVELLVFFIAMRLGYKENGARALTYTTLVVANLTLILSNLSLTQSIFQVLRRPNRALWFVLAGVLASNLLILYVPVFRNLFRFSFLNGLDLSVCFLTGILSVLWVELLKIPRRRKAARLDVTIARVA